MGWHCDCSSAVSDETVLLTALDISVSQSASQHSTAPCTVRQSASLCNSWYVSSRTNREKEMKCTIAKDTHTIWKAARVFVRAAESNLFIRISRYHSEKYTRCWSYKSEFATRKSCCLLRDEIKENRLGVQRCRSELQTNHSNLGRAALKILQFCNFSECRDTGRSNKSTLKHFPVIVIV